MSVVNSIDFDTKSGHRSFDLYQGDITQLGFPVWGIVVSVFSGRYITVPEIIMGAFHQSGVTVNQLFENKKFDYRSPFGFSVAEN
jgi:hypothetical protein